MKIFKILFVVLLGGCIFSNINDKPEVQFFDGTWEYSTSGGKIQMIFLPNNKFESKLIRTQSGVDSVLSDEIFRYTAISDSSYIMMISDSIIKSLVPNPTVGDTFYMYYKIINDTALIGSTGGPFILQLSRISGNVGKNIVGEWKSIGPDSNKILINTDSTGMFYGRSVNFNLNRDYFIYSDTVAGSGDGAWYYQIENNLIRLWQAKCDYRDTASICTVDDQYYLHKIK